MRFSRSWRLLWLWSSTCRRKRILLCKVCTTFLPSSRALEGIFQFQTSHNGVWCLVSVRVCVPVWVWHFLLFQGETSRDFICKHQTHPLRSISGLLPISDVWEAQTRPKNLLSISLAFLLVISRDLFWLFRRNTIERNLCYSLETNH